MGGRIGPQNYGLIENSVRSRPLQVLTLRLSAHEPKPPALAQQKRVLLGPDAYEPSVSP